MKKACVWKGGVEATPLVVTPNTGRGVTGREDKFLEGDMFED
jgi:hypothetical protein